MAKAYIAQLNATHAYPAPIVTTIEPDPYIVYNDLPKISNLKRLFPALYKPDPTLVSAARS